jgi:hypothetical protein
LILTLVVFCSATAALSQSATTSLRGVVKDPSGALVPGAKVTLTDSATGTSYEQSTNGSGYYIFPFVKPATYQIAVTSKGFAAQSLSAELLVDQPATIDFKLSVQASSITIDVSSAAQTLNLTDASMGASVGNATIEALPLDGRDPVALLSLQPGVLYMGDEVVDSRQGAVAGGRSDQGNITLDGLDDNDQIGGAAFTGIIRSTLDSTEEFRVTTSNGTAEAGRSSGAQVNLITKSGTNKEHGSLYEYTRPTITVANSFFLKNQQLAEGVSNRPQKYIQNVFGGSVGGPIKRDKLFYFFNYEGLRIGTSDVVVATLPTASWLGGNIEFPNPSGGNYITGQGGVPTVAQLDEPCTQSVNYFNGATVCPWGPGPNPNILAYYAHTPVATGTVGGDGGLNSADLFFTSPAPATHNTNILKLDYNLNSANKFFVRGNLQKDTAAGDENLPGQPSSSTYDDNSKAIAFGHTWTPTAHLVNDLRYAFIRQGYQYGGIAAKEDYVDLSGLTQPTAQTRNSYLHVPVNNIIDTLSWSKGTHTLQFGGNWRMISNQHGSDGNSYSGASTNPYYANTSNLPNPEGVNGTPFTYSFQYAYGNLVGIVPEVYEVFNYKITSPTTGTALPDGAFITRNFRANEFEWFVQDTWHARRNLTFTAGVRHTILQTPYEVNGQQISPTIDMDKWYHQREASALQGQVYEPTIYLAPSGKANGAPGFWPKQKENFAPRLGVVFAPSSKTSIRASAGFYFDHYGEAMVNEFDQEGEIGLSAGISNAADELSFENSPRFTGPNNVPNGLISVSASPTQSFPYAPPISNFGINWGIDNHLKTPYAEAFNFSIQHEFPGGFTFEEAYVGRLGRHLLQQIDLAEPTDYVDPGGGGDYFSNAKVLSVLTDGSPFGNFNGSYQKIDNNVPALPYFEHLYPYMQNTDYAGESATQAIFNNFWAPERYTNGETLSLAILDFYNNPNPPLMWSNQFSSLFAWNSIGTSSYNALQFTLRHPPMHGFSFDFGYTFSKSLDIGSETERASQEGNTDNAYTNFAIQNTWNPKLNKGPSDFDTRSLITVDWVYKLPVGRGQSVMGSSSRILDGIIGGWQFAGLARWTSGLPFTLESPAYPTNYNDPAFSFKVQPFSMKKHLVGGIPQIFDTATQSNITNGIFFGSPIRLPYAGEVGQRNNYRGDGYMDVDSSLTKSWKITERAKLKFAAEVYNISNTNRFDVSPSGLIESLASSQLGQYYNQELSHFRRMQFGLRVDF